MPQESFVDVLIIGAGPGGLMCANALAVAGVNVRIIDQKPEKITTGHADGIQPRIVEVMQSYGLAERLLREGNQLHMFALYNSDEKGGIKCTERGPCVTEPTSRFPFVVMLNQGAIEDIFVDSMNLHGVKVDRPMRPSAIELSEHVEDLTSLSSYPVKVTLERLDVAPDDVKSEVVRAKFVLGADGAHSWVRKAINISMDGEQTDYTWGVVDMIPDTDFPDVRNNSVIHSANGSCKIIARESGKVRLYTQLSDTDIVDPSTGRVDRSKMTPEKIIETTRKMLHPFELRSPPEIDWWTIYRIGQRIASAYSMKERIFIAGDACHTHSPKAGQGMNAALNDSHNLAWKLAHVLRGWARPSLLETYESERRKFAVDLINFDKQFAAVMSRKPRTEENPDGVTQEQLVSIHRTAKGFTSGNGVHYPSSAIVDCKHQHCIPNLIIGQRMPPQTFIRAADAQPIEIQDMLPADVRFKVLILAGLLTEAQLVKLNVAAEQLSSPSSFLHKYPADGKSSSMFDLITIVAGKKEDMGYLALPELFRQQWSKVLLDDMDFMQTKGGNAYERFGVNREEVTFVIIRPDGYVGMVAPSTALGDLDEYFASFLIPQGVTGL